MCNELLSCPFCGEIPGFPDGDGAQYEIYCDCGMAMSSVQISDLMSHEEKMADSFKDYRYQDEFIERAKAAAIMAWNTRVPRGNK